MNARILLILIIPPLLLSGCSMLPTFGLFGEREKPVVIQTVEKERTRLNLKDPSPMMPQEFKFYVVTPENVDKVWKKLEKKNVDLVLFAVTDEGYEKLAVNLLELRNYIDKQKTIIVKYREYYEPVKEEPKEEK